jgi:5S rRNA maturation endonuclease (ribonuclease M5)
MNDFSPINTKKCLICAGGAKNDRLHWHQDPETNEIWCWCQGACKRGYSLYEYCAKAGLSLRDFLKGNFHFEESRPNEVNSMVWPAYFLPLFDPRAKEGLDYVNSRGIDSGVGDMFYDAEDHGIVFPYYFGNTFVGAQVRYIEPWMDKDGELRKVDTIPGTRLGLLFYGFSQASLPPHIKAVIVCEGAFNALSLQQALNAVYGSVSNNPYRCVATSGCNLTTHHSDVLKELKQQGKKIILGYDYDEAGLKGISRAIKQECITHVAYTGDNKKDWNDLLIELGERELAKFFLKGVKPIEY